MPDTGTTAFDRWRALVAPPDPGQRLGPPTVDWAQVHADLGLRLPTDYRAYIETYGIGWINRLVWVAHPTTGAAPLNLARNAREQDDPEVYESLETAPPHPLGIGPDRLFFCAGTETQDALYWYVNGEDPDRWPIVHRDQEGYRWQQYDTPLTGFLTDLFTGQVTPSDYAAAGYLTQPVEFDPNPWGHPIDV
jgi:hypothetical protein